PCQANARIYVRAPGDANGVEIATGPIVTDITTGGRHTLRVTYTADDHVVTVRLDGNVLASGDITTTSGNAVTSLEDLLDSRFGFFGFSASTTATAVSDTFVYDFTLRVQPSEYTVATALGNVVDWGRTVNFVLIKRDSCQEPEFLPDGLQNDIYANLTFPDVFDETVDPRSIVPEDLDEGFDFLAPTAVTYNSVTGSYLVSFTLPLLVEGPWTLQVGINTGTANVSAANTPFVGAVITEEPEPPSGIPAWGLSLLITIIVLIVLGLMYAVVRLRRYRQKLRENADDIDAGKEKHHLDQLDQEVDYSMNPMLGTLDEMKKKLAENEKELERLRSGKSNLYDDDTTIASLQEQNQQLREEMNAIKVGAGRQEADKVNFGEGVTASKPTEKKQFEQRRAG
ncbi:Lectin_legB domain-containing protein, partial [Durusdinium trenchii]